MDSLLSCWVGTGLGIEVGVVVVVLGWGLGGVISSCDEVERRVVEEQHQLFKARCCVKNPKQPWLEALT